MVWGLRDYGVEGQIGLEPDYRDYIKKMVEVGREIWRVLRKDGSWYLNLGDTYFGDSKVRTKGSEAFEQVGDEGYEDWLADNRELTGKVRRSAESQVGITAKCKLLMPYRVALALVDDGWVCRSDITWHKPNAMPSSVKDRLTCQTERVFHLVKSRKYWYDLDAIREPHSTATIKRATQPTVFEQTGGPKQDMLNPITGAGGNYNRPAEMVKSVARKLTLGKNPGDVVIDRERKQPPRPNQQPQRWERGKNIWEERFAEGGRNPGDFWEINTQPSNDYWCPNCKDFVKQKDMRCVRCGVKVTAHFAVYPEALCERPIKSSCPDQVCKKCGRPRERITEKKGYIEHPQREGRKVKAVQFSKDENKYVPGGSLGLVAQQETIGWTDCGCGAGFESGIVLDPMCGSGTTLVVAKRLGMRFIGIDLNPDYCEMARKRLARVERPIDAISRSEEDG